MKDAPAQRHPGHARRRRRQVAACRFGLRVPLRNLDASEATVIASTVIASIERFEPVLRAAA